MKLKPETRQRVTNVTTVAKLTFQFGFIPFLLYLGRLVCSIVLLLVQHVQASEATPGSVSPDLG